MEFKNVAILLTEDCNAKCKMCCDSRGLVRGKTLSNEELDRVLFNIREYELADCIGITGGEPLLYRNLIDQIMNYDFGREVRITLKTNGFWGRDINTAKKIISQYAHRLTYISLSYDEFHLPFISIDCIKNVILAAKENNIATDVVGCFLKDSKTPGEILDMLGDTAYYTKFCYQPVIATGSGALFPQESYIKILNVEKDTIRCIAGQNPDILINPRLEVFPCCSQTIENTILKVGSLMENSLHEVIADIKHNYIINTILTEGFTPFIQLLNNNDMSYPRDLSSPCEFCEFLFKDDAFLKLLNEVNYYENIYQ